MSDINQKIRELEKWIKYLGENNEDTSLQERRLEILKGMVWDD